MENQNSVCYVARINEIKPIEGADNIEQAVVGGWNCIVQKNTYKANDLVVVATTDAIIPQELSDKMNVTNYLRKGQRVRTVKLRGVYSECLLIPTKYIPGFGDVYYEGMDMMEKMGIFKWEPPVRVIQTSSGRKVKYKDNPLFSVYHKFPNLKNVPGLFTNEDMVEISRKIHGTNCRFGIIRKAELTLWDRVRLFLNSTFGIGGDSWRWCGYEYFIGSHNVVKDIQSLKLFKKLFKKKTKTHFYSTDVWSEVADKLDIKNKLWKYAKQLGAKAVGEGIIIYGEIYGPGIQKNYDYGLKELAFAGFDVKWDGDYCNTYEAWEIITRKLELEMVPGLYVGEWSQEVQDKYVFDNFIEGTKIPHEGVVIKHISGDRQKVAKVINPDYLIYSEKHDVGDSH